MPTTALYRKQWNEYGEGLQLDIIPRSNAALPGGYAVVTLPDDFIFSWKINGAKFPSDRPWGLHQVPSLVIDLKVSSLTGSTALSDLDTYLQDPVYPAGGSVAIGDGTETFDTSNIWVLWSDNGTGGAAWECIFVGAQRLIPGEEEEITGVGEEEASIKSTFTIAHAALYCLESIPTDWLARRAISQETPLGPYDNAFNLIYYSESTARVYAYVEDASGQEIFLYSAQDMFGTHLAYLATQVYIDLLRGAYDAPTVVMKGYHTGDTASTNGSPVMVPMHYKPDYSENYGINADDPDPIAELYVKGVINDSSDDTTLGGWYSELSEASVYQWTHCWDLLVAHCDTSKSAIWQEDPAALEFHFMPLYMDAPDGTAVSVELASTDIHGGAVKRSKQKGVVKGASVECPTNGGDDKGTHPATAKGIRSEEEVTLSLALTNQIPMADDFVDANGADHIESGLDFRIARLAGFTTNTLYFVDTPTHTLGAGSVVLTDAAVPVLAAPQVHIYGGLSYFYEDGYDMTACTPLPTTETGPEFVEDIAAAIIAIQNNAGLPHVLASYIIEEFGAGNATNAVHYEITTGRPLLQKVRMKHLGLWIELDASIFLPAGSTRYDGDPSEYCLYDWAPAENGTAVLKLIGYTRNT